ncbi:MAG: glycerophosphodiester phosphodiesterase family protein [Clostridia bacterium]
MDILEYKLIAHRGLHSKELNIPENSIPAFEKAVAANFAIELDVHVSLDKQLVVFHDHNLLRMTGLDKEIELCTLDEIKSLKLNNTKYTIPTFDEVLKIVDKKVALLIEIKNNKIASGPEIQLLKALQTYDGHYAIESFNPISIKYFKDNAPNIARGLLTQNEFENIKSTIKSFILKNIKPPKILLKLDFISYKIDDLTEDICKKYKKNNMYIFGWTIANKEQYEKAKKMCDGIIFDNI